MLTKINSMEQSSSVLIIPQQIKCLLGMHEVSLPYLQELAIGSCL